LFAEATLIHRSATAHQPVTDMPHISNSHPRLITGVLGAVAVALTLGAAQLASGSDLKQLQTTGIAAPQPSETAINRSAKADREQLAVATQPGQTIAVQLQGEAASSILVRIPGRTGEARPAARSPGLPAAPISTRKPVLACEPVVSVLTEVAKLLQPGRCFT
jgi:hypothetical protein